LVNIISLLFPKSLLLWAQCIPESAKVLRNISDRKLRVLKFDLSTMLVAENNEGRDLARLLFSCCRCCTTLRLNLDALLSRVN
jgi:hypothetical protein